MTEQKKAGPKRRFTESLNSVLLTEGQKHDLVAIAQEKNLTVSDIVRAAIDEYIATYIRLTKES